MTSDSCSQGILSTDIQIDLNNSALMFSCFKRKQLPFLETLNISCKLNLLYNDII